MTTDRLPPLDPEQRAALDGDNRFRGVMRGSEGEPFNIFLALAHHPDLLGAWLPFGARLLVKGKLPVRDRELLILRTGWLCGAPYEWGQHVVIAKAVGITDEEIDRIATGPAATGWDPFDALLLRAADDLHDHSRISESTWSGLAARYDAAQLVEVTFVVGQYHLVSFFLNSAGVHLDDGLPGMPRGPLGAGHRVLDYTILVVDDVDRAVGFYTGVLGLEMGHRAGPFAQLSTGNCRLAFYARDAMVALVGPDADIEIGFLTDDVDAAFAVAVAGGATPVIDPADRPWGQRTAYVRDPDGHLVEFAQTL